jgi:phosphonate transport system substrate-binding protein
MRFATIAAALAVATGLAAGTAQAELTEINFGIISTENSQALRQQWTPVLADMEKATGLKVNPFFAPDYAGVIEAMRFNKVQLGYFGNKSAMEAVDRSDGEIFAQVVNANGSAGYYSLLITHKDSDIHSLADILSHPGKYKFGNGDPNSTSGFLVPGYYVFAQNKIDAKTHFKNVVSASHETNLMAVLNKQVDVATNNNVDMEKVFARFPDRAGDIRIVWKSPLIAADPLVWRKDLPESVKTKIRNFILAYGQGSGPQHEQELANLKVLTWSGWKASNNDQLLPIRQLELFKTRAKVETDGTLATDEKQLKLAEIDKKLADLQKVAVGK